MGQNSNDTKQNIWKDFLIRAIFVVTFVVVIAFGAWGGVSFVKYVPDAFSRIGENVYGNISAAVIEIGGRFVPASHSSENEENSGGIVVVNREEAGSENAERSDNDAETASENETGGTGSIAIAPDESGTETTLGGQEASQSSIAGEETETTTALDETPVFNDPNGTPDLSIAVSAVGILDPDTNEFVAQESMGRSDRGAVLFSITNIGTKTIPEGWIFKATLPTLPRHIFTSEAQQELAPGDRIEFTLGFDSIAADADGNATVSILVDPNEVLDEITRENNATSAVITISIE